MRAQSTTSTRIGSLVQTHTEIDRFQLLLDRSQQLRDEGAPLSPQVANRATGILIDLQSDEHTFSTRKSYRALAHLPLPERIARLRGRGGSCAGRVRQKSEVRSGGR